MIVLTMDFTNGHVWHGDLLIQCPDAHDMGDEDGHPIGVGTCTHFADDEGWPVLVHLDHVINMEAA